MQDIAYHINVNTMARMMEIYQPVLEIQWGVSVEGGYDFLKLIR